jgi:hypothetical protein
MTTGSGVRPDEEEEGQPRRERGGASVEDMSKGIVTDEADSPFGGSGEDTDKQKEERDE